MSFIKNDYQIHELLSINLDNLVPKEYNFAEIYNMCDIHYGARSCDYDLLNKFLEFTMKEKNRFLCINGDLVNNNISTSKVSVFDDEYTPRQQRDNMIKLLKPLKSRVLFILDGNHESRTKRIDDTTLTEDIANSINVPYYGDQAIVKIKFGGKSHHYNNYILYVTHGNGGGRSSGTTINAASKKLSFISPDIIFIGHKHDPIISKPVVIKIDQCNNTWKERPVSIVCGSSFQKWEGYGVSGGYSPKSLGCISVRIDRDKFNHVSEL